MSLLIKYLSKLNHICAFIRNYKLKIFYLRDESLKPKAQSRKLKTWFGIKFNNKLSRLKSMESPQKSVKSSFNR
ncbi:hypothetical protein HYN43_026265 [Mucilaginibacter celer]|uniref:Uncharacterized protein n=1 Tax=Mucilaginibacter celer TaxID=2305508 RepID=A0A494W4Z6_9SPHI|nr:hypothetical protein HYN43_026265 [Mucilaginibacter celer]